MKGAPVSVTHNDHPVHVLPSNLETSVCNNLLYWIFAECSGTTRTAVTSAVHSVIPSLHVPLSWFPIMPNATEIRTNLIVRYLTHSRPLISPSVPSRPSHYSTHRLIDLGRGALTRQSNQLLLSVANRFSWASCVADANAHLSSIARDVCAWLYRTRRMIGTQPSITVVRPVRRRQATDWCAWTSKHLL